MNLLNLIGRTEPLFEEDISSNKDDLKDIVESSRFLVIGGAGSIGQSVVKEIFKLNPKCIHVVDISENNMVELVRDLRSTIGYISGEFKTYALDCGSKEFESLISAQGPYDYIFNLSALKHVRSEKDPYTLMRMINVNIVNTINTIKMSKKMNAKNYFCVSTDKAANPVNMMGASKRIMEMFLMRESLVQQLSMARFANVAFSDGSLLHGFNQRFLKQQPFAAPNDVKRYFITPQESGELCLLSGLLGENRNIFFPKLSENLHLIKFSEIAMKYLNQKGYEPYLCETEKEARSKINLIKSKKWPCYFFESDTTGEKDFEEFFTKNEVLDLAKYSNIGVIENNPEFSESLLDNFSYKLDKLSNAASWSKAEILELFHELLPEFTHTELGKNLDEKM